MRVKVADYIMHRLAAETGHVFFLPGGGCMHLVEALRTEPGLTPVACLHEQVCAIAADAYSQYTGALGAALVTAGPGSTNAITGVAASWIDSIPVVVVSGQAKTTELISDWHVRQMGVQEVDTTALVGPVTKYAAVVREPAAVRRHVDEALAACRLGRPGPVWLDVPLDVQGATVEADDLEPGAPLLDAGLAGEAELDEAAARTAELIAAARRPVVLAGNGVRQAGALDAFLAWIELVRLPLLTTWKAADFVADDHPLFIGRPGSVGQRAANFAQQTADLVIVLGARLDLPQVGFDSAAFAPRARKVVVDADAAEIDKLGFVPDVAVRADAGAYLRHLARRTAEWRDDHGWLARCHEWRARWPWIPAGSHDGDLVDTYALVDVLSEQLTPADVLVPGSSGGPAEVTMQAFRVKAGQRVFNSPGLGSMGFGLPASIGAAVASGRRVVTIIGDGGLQHNVQELQTLRRLGLPVKLLVLNNDGYGSIRASQRHHFDGMLAADSSSGLTLPDLQALARAYKLSAFRVEGNADLAGGVARALAEPGPVVCELMVDPDVATQPRLSTTVGADGRIVSSPLEDLWPFLDREELAAIMEG